MEKSGSAVAVAEMPVVEQPEPDDDLATENARLRDEIEKLQAELRMNEVLEETEAEKTKVKDSAPPAETAPSLVRNVQEFAQSATALSEDDIVAKDVANAVGLFAAAGTVATLGVELTSIDADLLALGLGATAAVVAEEDVGVPGRVLRGVGVVADPVIKASASAAKATAEYVEEQDLGWKARAALELGIEAAVRKFKNMPKK